MEGKNNKQVLRLLIDKNSGRLTFPDYKDFGIKTFSCWEIMSHYYERQQAAVSISDGLH